jgi:DNA-binding MarR family transcriptional regulator
VQELKTGRLNDLIGHLLRHAFRTGQKAFLKAYPNREITPLVYGVFELIRLNPGVSHNAICEQLGIVKSVLTTALKPHLEARQIIQRPGKNDERAVGYTLSPKGKVWFQEISGKIIEAEANLTSALSKPEYDQLKTLLTKLVESGRSSS